MGKVNPVYVNKLNLDNTNLDNTISIHGDGKMLSLSEAIF